MKPTNEAAFETVIETHLLDNGYVTIPREGFDRDHAIFPDPVLAFIRETQFQEWAKLEVLLGEKTGEQVLADLCKWMDVHGSLATLRHGFKCYGRTLRPAFFKAAHTLNPELEASYAANCLGITRQLRYFPGSQKSLDVTLSLNGIPVATVELKNPLTGQTVEDACRQYQQDRDPRESIFAFKQRTLVHFAADTESVLMTTRLAGTATHFLPFDKGSGEGGGGNPPDPAGRTYRTAYLWEDVLARAQSAGPPGALHPSPDRGEAGRPGAQGQGGVHGLPAPPPARGRPHAGGCRAPRRHGPQLPDRALRRQREKQYHRLARPSPRIAAR